MQLRKPLVPTSNKSGDLPANAIDDDLSTRWRTAAKMESGDWFQINLGEPTSVSQIVLDTAANNAFDSVFQYQVYVSNDGVNWGSAVTNGAGALGKTTITMPPQKAQYVRIVSTAPSFFFHWSIGEIEVYGAPDATGSIQAPTAVSKGLQLKNWTSSDGANVSVVYNGTKHSQAFPISPDGKYTYTLPGGTSAMFTTKSLSSHSTPALGSLTPTQGIPGYKFKITGYNFDTRYSSGTGQTDGMSVQVDMGQAQTFNAIALDAGSSIGDYARSAEVYVSSDGTNWTRVASIVSDGQQIQAASFPAQTARYIKVVNTGSAGNWWSIAEFDVYN